ncbi:unnamed protein product [Dicrocoelium dendriticum]|nr:unnamed protein product [Dicrocoelium dendriticum]
MSKNGPTLDDAEAGFVARRQHLIRERKSGKCLLARKRLKAVFGMRKYYRAVIALTGVEAIMVLIRLILETESLRFPPGNTRNMILNAQLSLLCISLFPLLLFVIEQPFKWWALGSRRFCKSVLLVLDAIVCIVCFSLNIYNIHMSASQPTVDLGSVGQLTFCGVTHTTLPANTAWTFSLVFGMLIVYRLWCIHGYIKRSVQKVVSELDGKLKVVQRARDEAETRVVQLESILREQSVQRTGPRGQVRSSVTTSSHTRSSGQHTQQ